MNTNIVCAYCEYGQTSVTTRSVFQHDYGMVLEISGIELPENFEIHFSNEGDQESKTVIGSNNQAYIPDEYLRNNKHVVAYLYLHDGTDDGETVIKINIPVINRAEPSDNEITPQEHSVISDAIALLNEAIRREDKYPRIIDGFWYTWDSEVGEFVNTGQQAQGSQGAQGETGESGYSPTVVIDEIQDGVNVTVTDLSGEHTFTIMDGAKGDNGAKGDTGEVSQAELEAATTLTQQNIEALISLLS